MTRWFERLAYFPLRDTPEVPEGGEDVWFEAADGTKLHGWFFPATTTAAEGAILACHGNAGNVSYHQEFVDFLPDAGFHVFLFDYRSYGRSERRRLRREGVFLDTRAAFETLLADPRVDPSRVAVYAQSLGGAFGLNLMAERPEVRGAVVMCTFHSWQEIAAAVISGGRPGPISRKVAKYLMRAGLDPYEALGRIRDRPVFLLHGTSDEIVPYEHARMLAKAGGAEVSLRTVPGGDHNGLRWIDPSIDAEIVDFYRRLMRADGDDGSDGADGGVGEAGRVGAGS